MSIALLIGAPQSSAGGGTVRLMAGSWVIKAKGLISSKLHLHIDDSTVPLEPDHKLVLDQGCEARVSFTERGSEDYVSIIAEKLRCP